MVCAACKGNLLPARRESCAICAEELSSGNSGAFICSVCRSAPPAYARAVIGGRFSGPLRALIITFKYLKGHWLTRDLTDMIEPLVRETFSDESIALVVPIPMSRRKENKRGYNQADLLARELASRLGTPVSARLLSRTDAATQTRMTASERRRQAALRFKLRRFPAHLKGKTILLVDDVMTTGATFSTCARLLRKAGAGRILAAAIGRTPRK